MTETLKRRMLDLATLTLEKGAHNPDHTFCVMEAVAYIAGESGRDPPGLYGMDRRRADAVAQGGGLMLPNACPKPAKTKKARRGSLEHGKPLTRSPMKSRGPRTKKSGGTLFPKNVDEPYREWIRGRQCLIAGRAPRWVSLHNRCQGVTQVAHVKSRGSGDADHRNVIPLCAGHHHEQHAIGKLSFEARYALSLRDEAELLSKLYVELGVAPSPDPRL